MNITIDAIRWQLKNLENLFNKYLDACINELPNTYDVLGGFLC